MEADGNFYGQSVANEAVNLEGKWRCPPRPRLWHSEVGLTFRTRDPASTCGTLRTMPGVDAPLASPPTRPPVEPEPSLAPASTPASERVLPALVSEG